MDAIILLKNEHKKFRQLLSKINKKSHRYQTKLKMFSGFCQQLIRHEMMEQKVWYPSLKKNKKLLPEIQHLLSEEKHAEKVIKKLNKIKNPEEWEGKFKKFKKAVEHHAKEEEQKLFPRVRKKVEKVELREVGQLMQRFRSKYKNKKFKI